MKVCLLIPSQDATDNAWDEFKVSVEGFDDGPSSSRIAVAEETRDDPLMLDKTAAEASYTLVDHTHDQAHLAAFSTAVHTVHMFEAADVLAQPVGWRDDRPRLDLWFPLRNRTVSPGYDPRTGRLEFPWYKDGDSEVHSGRSRDIVAHETAHAILDGLAPDLADATTPQSLAIHECIADLVAFISALQSRSLRRSVSEDEQLDVRDGVATLEVFARIAESYAKTLKGRSWLRSLCNVRGLPGCSDHFDALSEEELSQPHALGEVLSGVMFDFAPILYEMYLKGGEPKHCRKALRTVANQFKRLILRPIDYLAPGDLTFADLLNTVLASDLAIHPYHLQNEMHLQLLTSLADRGVATELPPQPWRGVQVRSPGSFDAQQLGEKILRIRKLRTILDPPSDEVVISVRRASKQVIQVVNKDPLIFQTVRIPEFIVKFCWTIAESGPDGETALRVGATVVLDEIGWVRLVVRARPENHRAQRHAWMQHALALNLIGENSDAPILRQKTASGLHSYSGTGRSLHLCS